MPDKFEKILSAIDKADLKLDKLEDLNLSLAALTGFRDGSRQAITYLYAAKVGYLEVLNKSSSNESFVESRKLEILAELKNITDLNTEYNEKHKQMLHDLLRKFQQ